MSTPHRNNTPISNTPISSVPSVSELNEAIRKELNFSLAVSALSLAVLLGGLSGVDLDGLRSTAFAANALIISGYTLAVLLISSSIISRAQRLGKLGLGYNFMLLAWIGALGLRLMSGNTLAEFHLSELAGSVLISAAGGAFLRPDATGQRRLVIASIVLLGCALVVMTAQLLGAR